MRTLQVRGSSQGKRNLPARLGAAGGLAPGVQLLNIRLDWETEHIDVPAVWHLESAAAKVIAAPISCPCPFLSGVQI